MNESKFSVASGVRLAMVILAFVAALVAVQAFGAKPAEALCATPLPPAGKDPFAEAPQLRVGTGSTVYCMEHEGTTAGATMEAGENPGHTLPIKTAASTASATACGGR
jgi:hypothetical protein